MFNGPGRYDDLCTQAREAAGAIGAVLIILEGEHGNGFAVQATLPMMLDMPKALRRMADSIEAEQRAAARPCPRCEAVRFIPFEDAGVITGYCGECHEFAVAAP